MKVNSDIAFWNDEKRLKKYNKKFKVDLNNLKERDKLYISERFRKEGYRLSVEFKKEGLHCGKRTKYISEIFYCYNSSLKLDIGNEKTYLNKSYIFYILNDYGHSLETNEELIRLNPNNSKAWHNKILILQKLKKYREALFACDDAIERFPKDAYFWYDKSIIHTIRKKHKKALECCDNALNLDPENPYFLYKKGLVLGDLEKYGEGIKFFERAFENSSKARDISQFVTNCLDMIDIYERKEKTNIKKTTRRVVYEMGLNLKKV